MATLHNSSDAGCRIIDRTHNTSIGSCQSHPLITEEDYISSSPSRNGLPARIVAMCSWALEIFILKCHCHTVKKNLKVINILSFIHVRVTKVAIIIVNLPTMHFLLFQILFCLAPNYILT